MYAVYSSTKKRGTARVQYTLLLAGGFHEGFVYWFGGRGFIPIFSLLASSLDATPTTAAAGHLCDGLEL